MIPELSRANMDTSLLNELPGLNCLLEKHRQMQERSVFKTQVQQSHGEIISGPNVTGYPNPQPLLQTPTGYYNPNPMLPSANAYYDPNPMLQFANNYYNPNPVLQPPNSFYQPNPMLQYANGYYDQNPVLQCTNGYYNPNPVNNFFNSNNYYNQNGYQISPGMSPVSAINYQMPQAFPSVSAMHCQVPQVPPFAAINYQVAQGMPSLPPINYQIPQTTLPVSAMTYQLPQQPLIPNGSYHIPQEPPPPPLPPAPPVSTNKVYLNPNYNKNKVTQVNSHKSLIYVNPKMIHNVNSQKQDNQLVKNTNSQNKLSGNIYPKLTQVIPNVPDKSCNEKQTSDIPSKSENNVEASNVNACVEDDTTKSSARKSPVNIENNAEAEFTKNDDSVTENLNSSLIVLSRRKLVRVKRNSKITGISTSPLKSGLKKMKSPKKKSLNLASRLYNINNLKFVRNIDPSKTKWCNQTIKSMIPTNNENTETIQINSDPSTGLVSIDGVLYKKSRNKLVRSNSVTTLQKRKRNSISSKDVQYYIAKNGKKLQKLDLSQDKNNSSIINLNISISPVKNYKTNVSNKVKQRSLQILRGKMRKNNQPCLLFQKFGYCANQLKGTCSKVHDKKQVAVCRNFLQGKCLLTDCPLSHDIGPEKMPTCKYFLEGCCTREGCPYLHVKVSSKKPICVEFLRGYCPQGNECQNRHIKACPEFDKSGSCSKGKFCPYPHKSPLTENKRGKKGTRTTRKSDASTDEVEQREPEQPDEQAQEVEIKKRYYDETSEDLSQKREKLLRQVDIMKDVEAARSGESPPNEEASNLDAAKSTTESDSRESEKTVEVLSNRPRRPPIGPLPAYIPIE